MGNDQWSSTGHFPLPFFITIQQQYASLNSRSDIDNTVALMLRHEWGKMTSLLTKLFGPENLQLAEDVVQDTFLKALNQWKIHGLPENPSAWIITVARNKAIDVLRQQKRRQQYSKPIAPQLQSEYSLAPSVFDCIQTTAIDDEQLRMMFVCCNTALPPEAQVAVILRTLCGFSIKEIARAFMCPYDTIEKRLYRARQALKENKVSFELPPAAELNQRLQQVLTSIYLLFNEGYNATHHDTIIRNDLMVESIRLCEIISRSNLVENGAVHALLALMHFTSARSAARLSAEGDIILLKNQDRSKWNQTAIRRAITHLEASSTSNYLTKYHLEAGIAFEHSKAPNYADTNWQNILRYYDVLMQVQPAPIVALNRSIVVAELQGAKAGIAAILQIPQLEQLKNYYLLPATLGELYSQVNEYQHARHYLQQAMQLTHSPVEKRLLQQKLDGLPA
jgi:RNA polymerase sigma factor (sigma-70 family)